eukprot:CAMPEP_0194528338 /NCGR_PEP_ID=MMETSP0253-20130528/64697_1 /TAXON_ID=2966 /ORGANISM="Noctiluca scintillans" /LENGTH=175 /DNA_ID=CAMNT_0039373379 /DNA_START=111 /DNA_END=633 /DNA_ORIENTATION=-
MMTFCKEFNARTSQVRPEVPIQVTIVPKSDRTWRFILRTPQTQWFLLRAARMPQGGPLGANGPPAGNVTLKEVYHIAKAKQLDPPLVGKPMRALCMHVMHTARAMGIVVSRELLPEFAKRDDTPVTALEAMKKEARLEEQSNAEARQEVADVVPRLDGRVVNPRWWWCDAGAGMV